MPYLYKVIRESLRICPPIPFVFRRATEDVTLSGHVVSKGVCFSNYLFLLHIFFVYDNPLNMLTDTYSC